MIVLGVKRLCFADKEDPTKAVSGVQLFCGYPIPEDEGEGYSYGKNGGERLFISDWMIQHRLGGEVPGKGAEIEPIRNAEGKLQKIIIVNPEPVK